MYNAYFPHSHPFSVQHCGEPGSIENGQMEGHAPFTCASNVKYTCNEGYWLLGRESPKCGIDGYWTSGKPACIDICKDHIESLCDSKNSF